MTHISIYIPTIRTILFPHIYRGIKATSVLAIYPMIRDQRLNGEFLSIEGLSATESGNGDLIDVYVGGDGGSWSCCDATLFKVPTEAFDLGMLTGRLESAEDLRALVSSCAGDTLRLCAGDLTSVWVQTDGTVTSISHNLT